MKLTDDEVLARLRASFQETAARTPIGDGRLDELTIARLGKDRRTMVAAFSAAAAVAVIAGTGMVLANVGTSGSMSPASGGLPAPTAACTPHNYYVIASKQQLAGMTYLLPAPPPGYTLYGAWGTIDRNLCPDTVNWYVEYDKVVDGRDTTWRDSTSPIQLQVAVATAPSGNGDALRGELGALAPQPAPSVSSAMAAAASSAVAQASSAEAAASRAASAATASGPVSSPRALPSAVASQASPGVDTAAAATWQTVTVDGHPGKFIGAKSGTGTLVWSDGNLLFQLNAPVVGGDSGSIVKLAEQLVAVSPSDPRIQPPANCDVPAGAVCPDARG